MRFKRFILPAFLLPLLAGSCVHQLQAFTPPPEVRGVSVLVVDARTGQIMYQRNANEKRQIGSTQKLLTSLIVAEDGNLDHEVVIDPADEAVEPTTLQLKPGTAYTRRYLLTALLVKSPNDVARALGRDNAGSIEAFAEKMNAKAASLGATSSHFVNPNGLPSDEQYSTAMDLSRIARADYAIPLLRSIMTIKYLSFRYADGHVHVLRNTNETMRDNWFCNGMKTGYTDKARHCLVTSGSYNGRDVICIILGSSKEAIFSDSARMLRWALDIPQQTVWQQITSQPATPDPDADNTPVPKKHHRHHRHTQSQQAQ
jgi:D-alanyl-D-alanine carboxypeptidase (penicillin-binding protein 5/6)